jgi:hypothetical protein
MKSNIGAMISEKRKISIKAAKSALAATKRQKLGEANVAAVALLRCELCSQHRGGGGVTLAWRVKTDIRYQRCANRASTISQHRAARYFGTRQSAAI